LRVVDIIVSLFADVIAHWKMRCFQLRYQSDRLRQTSCDGNRQTVQSDSLTGDQQYPIVFVVGPTADAFLFLTVSNYSFKLCSCRFIYTLV